MVYDKRRVRRFGRLGDRRFDGLIVGPRSPVGSILTRLRMTAAQGPRLRAGRGRTRRWGPVAYADSVPTGVPAGGVRPPPLTSLFAFVGEREVMLDSSSPCSLHTRGLSFSFLLSHGATAIGSGFASASSPCAPAHPACEGQGCCQGEGDRVWSPAGQGFCRFTVRVRRGAQSRRGSGTSSSTRASVSEQ